MNPKFVKFSCIASLLMMFAWWFAEKGLRWTAQGGGYMELLALFVCVASVLLLVKAAVHGKYFWAVAFLAIAVLFNPFNLFTLSRMTFLILDAVCVGGFVISLALDWKDRELKPAFGDIF